MRISSFFIFFLIFGNILSSPLNRLQRRICMGLYKKELKKFSQLKAREYLLDLVLDRTNHGKCLTSFEKPKLVNRKLMNDNLLHIQNNRLRQLEADLDNIDQKLADEIKQMDLLKKEYKRKKVMDSE